MAGKALTVSEALEIYSIKVADATGTASATGSITPGKSANITVLDRDPFSVPPTQLSGTANIQTWFAGRLVHGEPDQA